MIGIFKYKSMAAFAASACLITVWVARAQNARPQPDPNAPLNSDENVGVWKELHISSPTKTRVKGGFASYPVKVTYKELQAGKLVFALNALTPSPHPCNSEDPAVRAQANEELKAVNGSCADVPPDVAPRGDHLLVMQDLADVTDNGFVTNSYVGTEKRQKRQGMYFWSPGVVPQLSSSGRYLLLSYIGSDGPLYPLVVDTRNGAFRGLTIVERGKTVPAPASDQLLWSRDETRVVYFGAQTAPPEMTSHPDFPPFADEPTLSYVPRFVYIHDWRSGTRSLAVKAQGVVAPLSWLDAQTLIYGSVPQDGKEYSLYDVKEGKVPRPNIYTYSMQTKKTKLLIKDGYRPTVSPDGRLIAFFGSRDLQHTYPLYVEQENYEWLWRYFCNGASLCVSKADGTGRIAFQPYHGLYPRIQWLPDSKRFVAITLTKAAVPTKAGGEFEAEVTLWNVETQTFKQLAKLHATNAEKPGFSGLYYSRIDFPFSPQGASADGKKVFVTSTSYKRHNAIEGDYIGRIEVLQSIDVETGAVSTIAKIENAAGMNWIPATSNAATPAAAP